ncbi:MAG: hypothetical protein U0736_11670 [Gemmataceae bacterium]
MAAIIVPLLPGLIGRAERAARATNSREIYKTIQTFQAAWTKYPNDWDALTDRTTTPLTWLDGTDGVHGNIGLGMAGTSRGHPVDWPADQRPARPRDQPAAALCQHR